MAVESSEEIAAVTQTTTSKVRVVLKEAADAGLSIQETARDMRKSITAFITKRAVRIARTELIDAMNMGSYTGAAASGLPLDKMWLATSDDRTRQSHNTANGQVVDLNGVFLVGSDACRFPADPALSARERINCRCTLIYKPKPAVVQGSFDF